MSLAICETEIQKIQAEFHKVMEGGEGGHHQIVSLVMQGGGHHQVVSSMAKIIPACPWLEFVLIQAN